MIHKADITTRVATRVATRSAALDATLEATLEAGRDTYNPTHRVTVAAYGRAVEANYRNTRDLVHRAVREGQK